MLRVAIVGCGPKGLFALERLLHHAQRTGPEARLDVDVFEPHPVPGAGAVYDPGQPEYLRMNFAAEQLDMWCGESGLVPAGERRPFVDWRPAEGERYPPRAQVGRYLADGFASVCAHAPAGVTVTLRPVAVEAAHPSDAGWRLEAAGGSVHDHDEILVATGHRFAADASRDAWPHAAALVPAVFPVAQRLSRDQIAPGATVAVRGFALTFVDAALALTEGRGGSFEADDHPYRVRHVAGAGEAGLLVPFSRTGRPMLAKPEPGLAASVPGLGAIAQSGRERILALPATFDLEADLAEILARATAAALLAADGRAPAGRCLSRTRAKAGRWLLAAVRGAPPPSAHGPAGELERSLRVGAGECAPDLSWALGQTWRALYPAIVERLGGSGMPDAAWPGFRQLAAQMERVAFGPPAVNAAKLLALVAGGRVDLTHVHGAQIVTRNRTTTIRSGHGELAVDAVVDAVLPGPGALQDGGLLGQLVADGHARIPGGRRGLQIAADATCIGREGAPTACLAAVGRPTEDCVIGNDTLSRSLHPQADRWAQRVAGRCVRDAMAIPA